MAAPTPAELRAALRDRFGFEEFRPGQERIVCALLDGRDVLAVMPTGAGKSLPYQLAGSLLPGLTLVVSPLIALMTDQLDFLAETHVAAGMVSSARTERENADALAGALAGDLKLLYVTPERFESADFTGRLGGARVSLMVVDEAHCISEWGHSFRPAYLELAAAAELVGRPPLLALTATAGPPVREDICARLGLRDPAVVVHGNDRPNLFYEVRRVEDESSDRRVLHDLLVERSDDDYPDELADRLAAVADGAGIVYTQTTRAANETAGWLREWGIAAETYHGRMRKAERERVQDGFMAGDVRVVCATNAFGLGVDKPDVRFVIHRDIPASVEAYMQEAGRAGRDGELARCTLVFRPGDLGRAAFLGATARLEAADVAAAHNALAGGASLTRGELARASGLGRGELARVVDLLREEGLVRERRRRLSLVRDFDPADVPLDAEERRRAYERSRLDMMRGYAETAACRREFLLNYVGEEYDADCCRLCDNHATRGRRAVGRRADVPFAVGDRVRHAEWGEGVVHRIGAEKVTVLFDAEGWKTLAADLVSDRELLVAVRARGRSATRAPTPGRS